jgi:hypothetical protein
MAGIEVPRGMRPFLRRSSFLNFTASPDTPRFEVGYPKWGDYTEKGAQTYAKPPVTPIPTDRAECIICPSQQNAAKVLISHHNRDRSVVHSARLQIRQLFERI